jgi:ketosteroid isomerase-like protein
LVLVEVLYKKGYRKLLPFNLVNKTDMDNKTTIEYFYTAFANGDADRMVNCYHDQVEFYDPAFGKIHGEKAKNMWRMLLSRNKNIGISFSDIHANDQKGEAKWQAVYTFGPTGRKVINKIKAQFEFADGKIIRHTDDFDIWKWAKQALGWKGFLLGWTPFIQNKIRRQANKSLDKFMNK